MPYDPSESLIEAVRFLVGDSPDLATGAQLTDVEIQFALDQASDNTYRAAAICARSLSARFARRGDESFETIDADMSAVSDSYARLARRLEAEARKNGGLGVPLAGGISESAINATRADTDRPPSAFYRGRFANPAAGDE